MRVEGILRLRRRPLEESAVGFGYYEYGRTDDGAWYFKGVSVYGPSSEYAFSGSQAAGWTMPNGLVNGRI
jgi:hypothetical protein